MNQQQPPENSGNNEIDRYYQIRVKSIKFKSKQATAIYFYDISYHIKSHILSK